MKRRIYAVMIVIAICAMTFGGCSKKKSTDDVDTSQKVLLTVT